VSAPRISGLRPRTTDTGQRLERNCGQRAGEPAEGGCDRFEPGASGGQVRISYLPQDEGMLAPSEGLVETPGPGLRGARVRISEAPNFAPVNPDPEGNYLFAQDDPRFDAANCYYLTQRTLKMAEDYLGRSLSWGFAQELGRDWLLVHPHAGGQVANAFYNPDAGSLNFFYYQDPRTGEVVRTAQSADVVSHETGHALLDALRHRYISSLSVGAGGFHESFGDMTAILAALHDDKVVEALLAETRGDLGQPNIVARLAERLGQSQEVEKGRPAPESLRLALNSHKYADMHFLPFVADDDNQPGQESHQYSLLFTGAFYDILVGLYQQAMAARPGASAREHLAFARDTAGRLLFRGMEFAPVGDISYREAALAMLTADRLDNEGAFRPLLEAVFTQRKILTPEDLEAFDRAWAALPDLRMPKNITTAKGALAFLEAHRKELGLPRSTAFEFLESHANKAGETFVLYGSHRDVPLQGSEYGVLEGSKMRMNGGLLLAFGPDGRLRARTFDDITDREIQDAMDHLRAAIAAGQISTDGDMTASPPGKGGLRVALSSQPGGPVLRRSSLIWG
jgi:hypothetical protein